MATDDNTTWERIREAGKAEFLEKGFRGASLHRGKTADILRRIGCVQEKDMLR